MSDNIGARVDFLLRANQEWKDRRTPKLDTVYPHEIDRRAHDSRPAQAEVVRRIARALYVAGNMQAISTMLDEVGDILPETLK